MSQSDSFIEEVTEEVRRDRLFALMRRYGWIAILAVLLLVGGAAYREWSKAKQVAMAQDLGDAMLVALQQNDAAGRIEALSQIAETNAGAKVVTGFLIAGERQRDGATQQAAEGLQALAADETLPLIYRQIASFKALTLMGREADIASRRAGFEALIAPGAALRLLAEEQLALIDAEEGNPEAAIARMQAILQDAEATAGLRQRATQVIVALGSEPELSGADMAPAASQ